MEIIMMHHFHEIWRRPQHGQLFSRKFVFGAVKDLAKFGRGIVAYTH